MFAARLEEFGDKLALICEDGRTYSYRELAAAADGLGERIGAQRGLLAIMVTNTPEAVVGYLAALRRNVPALLLNGDLDTGLANRLIGLFGANWVWQLRSDGSSDYVLSERRRPPNESLHPDLALLLSTSGSTGSPKLVRLSPANLQSNADSIAAYLALDASERPITTLPLSYSYGLSILNSHLNVGATVLLTDEPLTSREFWNFLKTQGATSLSGVPYTYEILRRLRLERMRLPSLRYLTQAGGHLPVEQVRFFANQAEQRGLRFYVMYGQTEATARISYLPPREALARSASIGRAIPGGQLRLIDDRANEILEPHRQGELLYEGPNVMLGYAGGAKDLALGDELGGTLRTGDIAYRDEDGFFYIVGRKKRFIKVYGNRIGLDEVELGLRDAGFATCVATGRDDMLVIATTEDEPAAVMSFLRSTYHLPSGTIDVRNIAEIPRDPSGKTMYSVLLKLVPGDWPQEC